MPEPLVAKMLAAVSSKSIGWIDTYTTETQQGHSTDTTGIPQGYHKDIKTTPQEPKVSPCFKPEPKPKLKLKPEPEIETEPDLAVQVSGLFEELLGLRDGFDPHEFLRQNQNQRWHPKAYLDTGQYLLKHLNDKSGSNGSAKFVIENPYTYGRVLLQKYSANHFEADNIAKSQKHKKGLAALKEAVGI